MDAQNLPDPEQAKILLETYKKHATELLAIEDAQQKLTTLLLAILGAGGSFLAGTHPSLSVPTRWGVTITVVPVVLIGLIYTAVRSRARESTRALLVRCEEALGFFQKGVFITNEMLYGDALKRYPSRGWWLSFNYLLVPAVAVGLLIVLWTM
jgi:hypothetical protein